MSNDLIITGKELVENQGIHEKAKINKFNKFKKITNTVVPSINKIIEKDGNLEKTKSGYDIIFKYIKKIISLGINTNDPNKIKEIFETINNLTKELDTKKLYVYETKGKLEEYNKLGLAEKLKQIVIPKNKNNISELKFSMGGNCHNWTLLYKDIFDELGVKTDIILFEPYTPHSLLLLNIGNNYFIADTEGEEKFNFQNIKVGDIIDMGSYYKGEVAKLKLFKVHITQAHTDIRDNFKPKNYQDRDDFIKFIDNKEMESFLLEYSDINKELGEKKLISFMVTKKRQKIAITLEGFSKENIDISIGRDGLREIKTKTNTEIIFHILRKSNFSKILNKKEIVSNIEGIISKMPETFMKEII